MPPAAVGPSSPVSLNHDWKSSLSPQRALAACVLIASGMAPGLKPAAAADSPRISRQAFLDQYCAACHNQKSRTAGLVLENSAPDRPDFRPEVWEKVVRKLHAGEMPPAGMPRPDMASAKAFTAGLVHDLDAAAQSAPYAGRPVIRRLNRLEYANAIRDLLAIELPVAGELPPDGMAAGFDNIGDALSMSPLLLEQYLKVARRVSEYAVGVSDPSPVTENFPAPEAQSGWLGPGMPFGTRGGARVQYYFPYDGEYRLRAFLGKDNLPYTEGVRFFQTRTEVNAGSHVVIVTFPDEFAEREGPVPNVAGLGGAALGGPLDTRGSAIRPTIEFRVDKRRVKLFEIGGLSVGEAAFAGQPGPPTLDRIEISGPYNVKGVSETPSRRRIFLCRPAGPEDEPACASKIISAITRRAFRRDVTAAEIQPFLAAYSAARRKRSFDASIAAALRDVLLAPDFLFRLEFDPPGAPPGSAQRVSGWELASRMSFFLWGSIPDDELLDAARSGKLRNQEALDRQVRRMLADPRAAAMADNFAEQWLSLRGLADVKPDPQVYPDFDSALAADFQQETHLFVRSVMRENRSVLDLIGADYTYLNERLARLYGIPGVIGPGFRRVSLAANPERGGLLGQGGILLLTSHTTKTSPILRGKWILDNLLNSPPPPPPPGVPPLEEGAANGQKLTTRQQIERHRKNAVCASCHARMDPLGFALENFDVIGRWRTRDDGGEIDPAGKLPGGASFSGPQGLKRLLLSRPDEFADATVTRLLTYALGRELDARDRPAVRQILRETEAGRYRFQDLIAAVVNSAPFQMRQTPPKPKDRS
jgi:mono/diheme cytochrome c family protein